MEISKKKTNMFRSLWHVNGNWVTMGRQCYGQQICLDNKSMNSELHYNNWS